jgi:apolipoprotein N-acyltransferase
VEFLRGYLFTGFPWAVPGLMADGMGGVLQFASVVGMPGLTLLILLWGMLPARLILARQKSLSHMLLPVLMLATLPVIWFWGEKRLQHHQPTDDNKLVVRLVQPNISQSDKWRSENADGIFNELLDLSVTPAARLPGAIIWPESAVSFLIDESDTAEKQIALRLQDGQTLLTGAIRRQIVDSNEDYFTSIISFDHEGQVTGKYDKWRLVPGGEYLPFAWALEPLGFRKVVNMPESFSAGSGPSTIDVPDFGPAAMLICYEAIFPHLLVPDGERPRWLVNVTNDGWFGTSVGPYQHFAQVRMRAVEQGLPVARSANTGISAMIDPLGRVVGRLNLGEQGYLDIGLPASLPPTIFAIWGNGPVFAIFLMLLSIAGFERRFLLHVGTV